MSLKEVVANSKLWELTRLLSVSTLLQISRSSC